MKQSLPIALLVLVLLTISTHAQSSDRSVDHTKWIAASLKKVEKIKAGMTRGDLDKLFTTDGGFSSFIVRRYVYIECRYIKVDVEFVGFEKNSTPRAKESPSDVIKSISKPYLESPYYD